MSKLTAGMASALATLVAAAAYLVLSSHAPGSAALRVSPGAASSSTATPLPVVGTVYFGDQKIVLLYDPRPPKVVRDQALSIARRDVSNGDVLSEPVAVPGLATNTAETDPNAAAYLQKRPVWAVTFAKVVMQPPGGNPFGVQPKKYPFRVLVLIDSDTGEVILMRGDGLEPVATPGPNSMGPEDCAHTAC